MQNIKELFRIVQSTLVDTTNIYLEKFKTEKKDLIEEITAKLESDIAAQL